MDALRAPFYALYDRVFYYRAQRKGMGPGFLHLLVLAAILSLVIMAVLVTTGLPKANAFVDWIKSEMPPLTWTPEGLAMNAQAPYLMIHPDYGVMATIDPTAREVGPDEMRNTMIFVTATRAYVRQSDQLVRVYDLKRPVQGRKVENLVIPIDADFIDRLYKVVRPWTIVLATIIMVPLFFLGNTLMAFLYSFPALILNHWRRESLAWPSLFAVSCYAMTGSVLVNCLAVLVPRVGDFTLGFLGNVIITCFYLYWGLIRSEGEAAGGSRPV